MLNKQSLEIDDHVDLFVKIDTSEIGSLIPFEVGITHDIDTVSVSINDEQLVSIINFLIGTLVMYQRTMKEKLND